MKRPKSDYVIQTVSNALRLLEAFRDDEELGVTELSRRLELHKNNVFRLLATLEERGYVEQCPSSERYRLAARCLEIGQAFARTRGLVRYARPALEALSAECGETSHLGVLRDFEVVHLDGEQPEQLVTTGLRVGRCLPVHCTALGKVLMAFSAAGTLERFDRALGTERSLSDRTEATITDRDKFFEHLRGVLAHGFALDVDECEPGMSCVAAPVHDGSGRLVAALSVSAPSFRIGPERLLSETAPQVAAAAERLSRHLGRA